MAHNLAEINGRVAMFAARTDAWHKLGQRTMDCVSWREAMRQAELDWQVTKRQLLSPEGDPVEAYGMFRYEHQSSGRMTFLGSVGAGYQPIQNSEAFDFVDYVIGAVDGAHYETAGALGNGERIWCLARIPHEIRIHGTDDVSKPFLLFTTSHDASLAATATLTTVRVVCQNTLNAALGIQRRKERDGDDDGGGAVRVRHTRNCADRLSDGRLFMARQVRKLAAFEETLNELARRRLDRPTYEAILGEIFPKTDGANQTRRNNTLAEISHLYQSNDRNAIPQIAGTALNLLNAITEHTDHVRAARGGGSSLAGQERARAESAAIGSGSALKSRALEIILEATENASRNMIPERVGVTVDKPADWQPAPDAVPGDLFDRLAEIADLN